MPLGWERINVRQSHPNKNIVFIKPLPGPDEKTSKDYLERIAAQCLPVMNKHHLAVASLEEYQPNHEFWGRNFNNGEVIQLVLRSPSTGHWLPFRFVQMVMMHELAHNQQMNHSAAFWAVRNAFAAEMRALWERGYVGDGLWGKGVLMENGAFARETLEEGEVLPEHMCGGTFRSRGGGRKRKAPKEKVKITYKERQERRVRRKFGANGVALGADDGVKATLEKGRKPAGKPRVAGSARGRELRAAAALARFAVKEEESRVKDEDLVTDSEAESDVEHDDDVQIKPEPDDAIDINGQRLTDSNGRGMVKVCEDEDKDGDEAKRELFELQSIPGSSQRYFSKDSTKPKPGPKLPNSSPKVTMKLPTSTSKVTESDQTLAPTQPSSTKKKSSTKHSLESAATTPTINDRSCPVCSVINDTQALTCTVCANVLKPEFVAHPWRCKSSSCTDGVYLNAGDVGICGVCGERRQA